jgi:ribonuclease HII
MANSTFPDIRQELALWADGYAYVAGVDEAGRGAWAGPVCAAAVILPAYLDTTPESLNGVKDSKLLSPRRREALLPLIRATAQGIGVGWATPQEVDQLGVVEATRRAMARAVDGLNHPVEALLLDYVQLPQVELPQQAMPKADLHCLSVAAASVVAKVERDRLMAALGADFPGYGFARNKGYGTRGHREALARLGPSPIHRLSWRPLRELRENSSTGDDADARRVPDE